MNAAVRPARTTSAVATGAAIVATVAVALAWTAVVAMFSLGADTGDHSEGNAGASDVAAILAILLVPVTCSLAAAWARPERRLRRATWTVVVLGLCVAGLVLGISLS